MKKKLLISFSGGETSAFMAHWLWHNKRDEYDMTLVFANTGQENEETYEFIEKFSKHFNIPVVWIEAIVHDYGIGNTFKIVDYSTADRDGKVFENIIKKHGIPNIASPFCTRELKQVPIQKYGQKYIGKDYYLAIGIREDECDRINSKAKEIKIIYPLISMIPMDKIRINFWWNQQPFRLNLKGYQGNCKWCWKKSYPKLLQLAKEDKSNFDFPLKMEEKYGNFSPEVRTKLQKEKGNDIREKFPITFFRHNFSAKDIISNSKDFNKTIVDDSVEINYQINLFDDMVGGNSCEIFSNCGDYI